MNQHICRCCLLENPALVYNIFDNNLRHELLLCIPSVHIELDDGLPEYICDLCWIRLRDALDFRRRCEAADQELRRRYEDTNRAIEEALRSGVLERIEEHMMLDNLSVAPKHDHSVDLASDTQCLSDFGNLEISMLSDLLLDDYSFSSPPATHPNGEDPLINELLSNVLNDTSFENTRGSLFSNESTDNSCSDMSSSTFELQINQGLQVATKTATATATTLTTAMTATMPTTMLMHTTRKSPKQEQSTKKSLHACTECEKTFTRNFQLKLHLISVHNMGDGRQYVCEVCQKTFASRHSLNYHHKSIHSAERPFACANCQRRFVLRTQLASHMRVHTGESKPRIYECMECGKCWPTKSDLRTHMRCHDPGVVRPFKCDRCSKSFFTRGHLNSHLLVHTGEKPYECSFCEKSYQSVGNLNNHLVRRHADILAYGNQLTAPTHALYS